MRLALVVVAALALAGCSSQSTDDAAPSEGTAESTAPSSPPPADSPSSSPSSSPSRSTAEPPYEVAVPESYDPDEPMPLVLVLHGYGSTGEEIRGYLGVDALAQDRGFLVVHPDGSVDGQGNRFWDATDACCNFTGEPTDDADRLAQVIADVSGEYAVDPDRVHVLGHSNGGFMAYRMACEHAGLVASVASISGATSADPTECDPAEPVGVLQVHGDADPVIRYEGGTFPGPYPGAVETVTTWAGYGGCGTSPTAGDPVDLVDAIAGAESRVTTFGGCPEGISVELWTIPGAGHQPTPSGGFPSAIVDWLLDHPGD